MEDLLQSCKGELEVEKQVAMTLSVLEDTPYDI